MTNTHWSGGKRKAYEVIITYDNGYERVVKFFGKAKSSEFMQEMKKGVGVTKVVRKKHYLFPEEVREIKQMLKEKEVKKNEKKLCKY